MLVLLTTDPGLPGPTPAFTAIASLVGVAFVVILGLSVYRAAPRGWPAGA